MVKTDDRVGISEGKMTAIQIEKIINIATIILPEVFALISTIQLFVEESDLPEATKEELIARIRAAQASVPEWK